ncbi:MULTISPECIES: protein-export chaperone SecB [Pseudovibrio]|uniref:protein-export chaperone SecB n=1 Tax=Stappiaceae TaxID=2821832 RepID=UPI00236661C5|nr:MULTISPECIES: protein-export chaperone SecB [Pseudovibrio]MDD7909722.1 protein-export chaperone SecB [Pseudovibrio exalbescens]MDX5592064.1 protein-export chaperone SecB [Pseudovibrio sp. SPO723]
MSDNQEAQAQAPAPGMNILAQYIKDLSFENPNSPKSLQPGEQPKLDINVNVGANPLSDDQFEVVLTLNAKANTAEQVMFAVELIYAGVFQITNVPKEHMHPFILIECPRMLFPFARNILADTTRNGGFPPLMLDPIDFAALYRQNLARMANQQQEGQQPN